eukprot:scaffold100678_cov78-Cyclotella_meneghiniana.AAC.1
MVVGGCWWLCCGRESRETRVRGEGATKAQQRHNKAQQAQQGTTRHNKVRHNKAQQWHNTRHNK